MKHEKTQTLDYYFMCKISMAVNSIRFDSVRVNCVVRNYNGKYTFSDRALAL